MTRATGRTREEERAHETSVTRTHGRAVVMTVMVAWVVATNAVLFGPAAGDGLLYRQMAQAAPGLPSNDIGSAYTGRVAPHYLVGLLAEVPRVSLAFAYASAVVAVIAGLAVVLHLLLRDTSLPVYTVSAGLVVLSPYAVRPYLTSAWTLQDLVFVLGVAVCLLGLLRRRPALVLLGLVVAISGRQSALPLGIVVAVWVAAGPSWRTKAVRVRWATAAGSFVLVALVYGGTKMIVAPFTTDFEPHIPGDTVLAVLDQLPSNARSLVAHVGRALVPMLLPGAVLLTALVLRRTRGLSWLTSSAVGCLVLAAAVVGQPIAIDPGFPGFAYNEQRLAALGLVPLVVGAALLLDPVAPRRLARPQWLVIVLLLALSSLHHLFTRVGPPNTAGFLIIQALAAVGAAVALWRFSRPDVVPPRIAPGP